jgi:hypothetical protein
VKDVPNENASCALNAIYLCFNNMLKLDDLIIFILIHVFTKSLGARNIKGLIEIKVH